MNQAALITDFERHLTDDGRSENTIIAYLVAVRQYLDEFGPNLTTANLHEFRRRFEKASTINVKLSAMRSFADYLAIIGEDVGGIRWPSAPPIHQKVPRTAKEDEVESILRHLSEKHRRVVLLLYECGLRIAESLNLKWEDVDTENWVMLVRRKGGNDQPLPIVSERLKEALGAGGTGYVVKGMNGGPISATAVRHAISRACGRAGVKPMSPHALRHGFAYKHGRAGTNVVAIQSSLGHTSLETTGRYLRGLGADVEALREALEAA